VSHMFESERATGHRARRRAFLEPKITPSPRRPLARDEEAVLFRRIRQGDRRALEELVAANQGLVGAVARRQCAVTPDASLDDLHQEGNIALLHAIDKFDPERGFKFSTYAINWVHQAVARGAHKTRLIHVPEHVYAHMDALARADEVLVYATDPARSGSAAVTRDDLAREAGLTAAQAQAARAARHQQVSLDAAVGGGEEGGEGDSALHASIPAPDTAVADDVERATAERDLVAALRRLLSPAECAVMRWRYGLGGGVPRTQQDIGAAVGVTRSRVWAIEQAALRKLRAPEARRVLAEAIAEESFVCRGGPRVHAASAPGGRSRACVSAT